MAVEPERRLQVHLLRALPWNVALVYRRLAFAIQVHEASAGLTGASAAFDHNHACDRAFPTKQIAREGRRGRGKREAAGIDVGLTAKALSCKPHSRASGRAARRLPRLKKGSAGVTCKRRDAVRLALNEPARPAGAAFGGLSASAAS